MINIIEVACYLATKNGMEKALLEENMLLDLTKSIREQGKEVVHYADRSVQVEGIYIPAKGTKTSLMLLPDMEL